MPIPKPYAAPIAAGLPARFRNADRPQRVANAIVADAKRGGKMATNVETHVTGLGIAQLRTVVIILFGELAKALAAQRDTGGGK